MAEQKRKIRFLLFGRKAWAERDALLEKELRAFRAARLKIQIQKIVTRDDVQRVMRMVARTKNTWCNFCYGNFDIKVAAPLHEVLVPKRAAEGPTGSPLAFSPLPFAMNVYMLRAVRGRKIKEKTMVGFILLIDKDDRE